ncbi:MAG TPA: hypothetical protein VFN13_08850 [Rudaea sp.]|nr:hypothetical protein [Rudaea sp.]
MNCATRCRQSLVGGLLALAMFAGCAQAADFVGGGTGAIPDNNASGLNITFSVSGIVHPINRVRLRLTMTHLFVSDLEATLTSPNGISHLMIFGRTGRIANFFGYGSDLGGTYTFEDTGGNLWAAAGPPLSASGTIAPGHYSTSTGGTLLSNHGGCATSMAATFNDLSGLQVNGTWTLKIADLAGGDTGSVSSAVLSVLDDSIFTDSYDRTRGTCKLAQFDFSGTGRTSYAVIRKTSGNPGAATTWYILSNDGTGTGAHQDFIFGTAADYFGAGDFDGDGISDAVAWNPSTGVWTVRRSSRPFTPYTVTFGQSGDDPRQIGDYDGDGFDDLAVYRSGLLSADPSYTLIHLTRGGPDRDLVTGEKGAFANGGVDYTGNGRADIAIQANAGGGVASFRIYDGTSGALVNSFNFGTPSDTLITGNHAGNALYDITTTKSSGGNFVWTTYDVGAAVGQPSVNWGASATDYVLSGDYDGDGLDDYAVWHPDAVAAQNVFSIRPSSAPNSPITINLGLSGDYPVGNSRTH